MNRIPRHLHFCFGLDPTYGGRPWSFIHYLCVSSALAHIKPDHASIYVEYEPSGVWWELTLQKIRCEKIEAPREIFGNPLLHYAHRADVVRLEKLLQHGGIYLDVDVFVHRDFDDLLNHSAVLGEEEVNGYRGLCNGVILAERGAEFLRRWYEEYRWFRSKGQDEYWAEHSVLVPYQLMQSIPAQIKVMPPDAFHWPTWSNEDLELIFGAPTVRNVRGQYANHLWEALSFDRYLKHITPDTVRRGGSSFDRWAIPYVDELDNYIVNSVR
ncbi:glycosyltransferase family 32 protein [Microvirga sp. 2MCAF38]|uniref:glycosyltransferase family 32 protein n=1 Tax=Microvirga sp. 2MCAF38 TaxID=3232989 RepID=UPI003F954933